MATPDLAKYVEMQIREFAQHNNFSTSDKLRSAGHSIFQIFTPAWYNYLVIESSRMSRIISDESTGPDEAIVTIEIHKALAGKTEAEPERVFYLSYNDYSLNAHAGSDLIEGNKSETDIQLLAFLGTALKISLQTSDSQQVDAKSLFSQIPS